MAYPQFVKMRRHYYNGRYHRSFICRAISFNGLQPEQEIILNGNREKQFETQKFFFFLFYLRKTINIFAIIYIYTNLSNN